MCYCCGRYAARIEDRVRIKALMRCDECRYLLFLARLRPDEIPEVSDDEKRAEAQRALDRIAADGGDVARVKSFMNTLQLPPREMRLDDL
jgi:hypothetical protein